MTSAENIIRKLAEQALQEKMIVDALRILADAEQTEDRIEQKLLEIDAAESEYKYGELPLLRLQVLSLLQGLKIVEKRMDEYMVKYKQLIYAKETLLPSPRSKKQIHLRRVPPNQRRKN